MNPSTLRIAGLALAGIAAFAACGDDDRGGAADTSSASRGTTSNVAAYCDASLAIELLPDPDVDFETATPEEIGAAFQEWAEEMRPLLDEIETVLPDDIREPGDTLLAALDQVEATGDPAAFDNPDVAAANAAIHAFDLDNCGWEPVDVTMADYHFEATLPTSPGPVSFDVTNEGDEPHLAIVGRKKDSVSGSAEEALTAAESEEEFDQSFEFVGEAFAPPGDGEYTVVDLSPGEYILFCPIPVGTTADAEGDGPPHFTQGMVETFTVE